MIDSDFARRAIAPCGLLWLAMLPAVAGASAPAGSIAAQVETAARAQLARQAAGAGLVEPRFELTIVSTRQPPACGQPVTVEPTDTRAPARMRFTAACPGRDGWRYEFVVRAALSATVAVTAAPVAAGQVLGVDQLALERRDISAISDSIGTLQAAAGQASRRSLRAGEVLRQGQLAPPPLVKRGDPVRMLARHEQVEVSTAGEALDTGAQDAIVRVRNAATGQVLRMRVSGAGTVEPLALPALIR
jgi:flagella basal body P-ring formation protein FlgA